MTIEEIKEWRKIAQPADREYLQLIFGIDLFPIIDTLLAEVENLDAGIDRAESLVVKQRRQLAVATETLEIIASERTCVDNLLSNADIASTALERMKG